MLPKVGHGYSVEKNWVPQFEAAYDADHRRACPGPDCPCLPAPVADLPLTVVPAECRAAEPLVRSILVRRWRLGGPRSRRVR